MRSCKLQAMQTRTAAQQAQASVMRTSTAQIMASASTMCARAKMTAAASQRACQPLHKKMHSHLPPAAAASAACLTPMACVASGLGRGGRLWMHRGNVATQAILMPVAAAQTFHLGDSPLTAMGPAARCALQQGSRSMAQSTARKFSRHQPAASCVGGSVRFRCSVNR